MGHNHRENVNRASVQRISVIRGFYSIQDYPEQKINSEAAQTACDRVSKNSVIYYYWNTMRPDNITHRRHYLKIYVHSITSS